MKKLLKNIELTDLSVKKENTIERFIYTENDLILTDKIGYPQFYTQLVFEIDDPTIKIKTVINNEEGISEMSNCKKIERFKERKLIFIFIFLNIFFFIKGNFCYL